MKKRTSVNLLSAAVISLLLVSGCADTAMKETTAAPASMASPEATATIGAAKTAIKAAKANDWIWRDTEKFLKDAQKAADGGDNATAIKLAKKAKFEAEAAVAQYNYEKANPRGM